MNSNGRLKVEDFISVAEIIQAAKNGQKIELIKRYRNVSGKGLKDSKDAIESCQDGHKYDLEKLVTLFELEGMGKANVTKEQFMKVIDKAIDSGDAMYCHDMLDAVEQLCANLRKKGGLKYIEIQRELFINSL
jgi:hypothetical protein